EGPDDLTGRHPQPLRARLPREAGRAPGPLHSALVPGDQARDLPPLLRRVLRHAALGDDRSGGRHGAGGLPALARGRDRGLAGGGGREAVRGPRLHHLPPRRRAGALPRSGRALRAHRDPHHRPDAHRGRGLHPRVDPDAGRQDRRRLREHHADLPGSRERGGRARADRVREVPAGHGGQGAMTTAAAVVAEEPRLHYLNESYGVRSWLLTTDHKRVGLLYLISLTGAFFVGGFFAVMLRLELLTPAGDLLQAETYNKFFTMHGVIMVFFFLIPSIPAALGNFFLPLMIGAKDVAFPRLNLSSWYLYVIGSIWAVAAIILGGVDTGWTFYTPYSTTTDADSMRVIYMVTGVFILGFSSMAIAAISFLVWGHHMFTSQGEIASVIFSALTFLVAIPTAVKVFNWTTTLYKGSISLTTPMLYTLTFLFTFTIGGLTGLPLATLATDVHLTDSYFVLAHFHYVMMGGSVIAYLGGLHHWWSMMIGKI